MIKKIAAGWITLGLQLHSTLRIIAAFMFMQAGTMKLFAIPAGGFYFSRGNGGCGNPYTALSGSIFPQQVPDPGARMRGGKIKNQDLKSGLLLAGQREFI